MKRIVTAIGVFLISYVIAYWWGVYELNTNPPTIENDGDLATLGMMPIFLHIYGIAWGLLATVFYGISFLIKAVLIKIKSQKKSDGSTIEPP